jgi:hypothetical protein
MTDHRFDVGLHALPEAAVCCWTVTPGDDRDGFDEIVRAIRDGDPAITEAGVQELQQVTVSRPREVVPR